MTLQAIILCPPSNQIPQTSLSYHSYTDIGHVITERMTHYPYLALNF